MNISFKWCGRVTKCSYCGKPVNKDELLVVHSWWSKKTQFSGKVYYHPECFITHFGTMMENKVPKPVRSNRGRPSLGLTNIEKKKRAILLRTYPQIKDDPHELHLVKLSLVRLGGVPKSWL